MLAVMLLTAFALGGVAGGVYFSGDRGLSPRLAAAGSGLLVGLALFWILPEIAGIGGWAASGILALLGLATLALLDHLLHRLGERSLPSVAVALISAAAVHSFLDGWSTRLLSTDSLTSVAVPLGLGLHKIPEGLALGFVSRNAFQSKTRAFLISGGVECLTMVGGVIEPQANRIGLAKFGLWWESVVLCIVAGSFLFLGLHGMAPYRKRLDVVGVFVSSLIAVGLIAVAHNRLQ